MTRLGTLQVAAAALTGSVALYITLVVFGNVTDFDTNQRFVQHVLAMDTTFKDEDLMWRAIESRWVQNAAYIAIIVWEALTALVLVLATVLWASGWRRRSFARARRMSTLGLTMFMLLFGAGFVAIGGEWFAMWQSSQWNGLEAATRNFMFAGFTLLLVNLPRPQRE
ncbi:DUF2165 domain-containing protein [Streptomyces gobiensis]|uniref:DUF2165 domain-containing protein n=1 Tax=Streptomyces gobiensis TaxID=2875706 RepID=UPI001E5D1019|nr:DUF2165 domain-containing protein [Streptomyces gobiensis]UGY93990.1 DUF2165 domain-containing protein [Streptomyces gobiensis]